MKNKLTLFLLLFFLSGTLLAQQRITGTVQDESTSEAIPGVNVFLKGTTQGTISDFDGRYAIVIVCVIFLERLDRSTAVDSPFI